MIQPEGVKQKSKEGVVHEEREAAEPSTCLPCLLPHLQTHLPAGEGLMQGEVAGEEANTGELKDIDAINNVPIY